MGKQEILAGLDDGNTEWGSSYATSAAGGAGKMSLYSLEITAFGSC